MTTYLAALAIKGDLSMMGFWIGAGIAVGMIYFGKGD